MVFTKLTDAERAEFIELLRDTLDPELYDEDDLPTLRENKRKFEASEKREEWETQAVEDPEEEWEPYEWRAPEEWPSAFPPFTDEV